jgi:hypothetical protein
MSKLIDTESKQNKKDDIEISSPEYMVRDAYTRLRQFHIYNIRKGISAFT